MPELRARAQNSSARCSELVTENGAATVNGTPAIALSIKLSVPATTRSLDLTLYVDTRTYQPLRTVEVYAGYRDLFLGDWMPATPENIAQAKDASIPAGYTKLDNPSLGG